MKFWLGNQVSAEFEADPKDIAPRFWASRQGREMLNPHGAPMLERSLRSWLTDPEGFNSSWADEGPDGFRAVWQAVRDTWPVTKFVKVPQRGTTPSAETVQQYLPQNYWIMECRAPVFEGQGEGCIILQGIDTAGWTAQDYVIPRLASGLIHAYEITPEEASV